MLNCGIYKITNIKNGRCYIGQSTNLKERKRCHFKELRMGCHANQYLQSSFDKYGQKAFIFEVICYCEESELDDLEKYYIKFCNSLSHGYGYNIEEGGQKNKHLSEDTKRKISEKKKGQKMSEQLKEKLRQINKGNKYCLGKHPSAETKTKLSISHKGLCAGEKHPMFGKRGENNPNYGRKASDECRRKISEKAKSRIVSEETKQKLSKNHARHMLGKHLTTETKMKISEKRGKNYDLEPAIQEYLKCGKYVEAAHKCNVSENRLRKELKKRGLIKKRIYSAETREKISKARKASAKDITEALREYLTTKSSLRTICKKYHVSEQRLSQASKEAQEITKIRQAKRDEKIQKGQKDTVMLEITAIEDHESPIELEETDESEGND